MIAYMDVFEKHRQDESIQKMNTASTHICRCTFISAVRMISVLPNWILGKLNTEI
jgi:hypothetical protein